MQVERRRLAIIEEVAHESGDPADLVAEVCHVLFYDGIVPGQAGFDRVRGGRDAGEGIAHLMGDAADQASYLRHHLIASQRLLELDDSRDVARDDDDVSAASCPLENRRVNIPGDAIDSGDLAGRWAPSVQDAGSELRRSAPGLNLAERTEERSFDRPA